MTLSNVGKKLRTMKNKRSGTQDIFIVFDVDRIYEDKRLDTLERNIKLLKENGKRVYLVQQTRNFEDELCNCGYKNRGNLFAKYSKSADANEFKGNFLAVTNLSVKLKSDGFDPERLWERELIDELNSHSSRKYTELKKKTIT